MYTSRRLKICTFLVVKYNILGKTVVIFQLETEREKEREGGRERGREREGKKEIDTGLIDRD